MSRSRLFAEKFVEPMVGDDETRPLKYDKQRALSIDEDGTAVVESSSEAARDSVWASTMTEVKSPRSRSSDQD